MIRPYTVTAVSELSGHAEAVGGVALPSFHIAWGRRAVEEIEVVRSMFEAVTKDIDGAAFADLALQPSQKHTPRWTLLAEIESLGRLGLRLPQEGGELRQVHTVLPVVVLRRAADPARPVGRRPLV
jgi:hypothetical protein